MIFLWFNDGLRERNLSFDHERRRLATEQQQKALDTE